MMGAIGKKSGTAMEAAVAEQPACFAVGRNEFPKNAPREARGSRPARRRSRWG